MTLTRFVLVAMALFGAGTSCNRPLYGSAEAPEGGRYVVGQDGSKAAVWWCPQSGGDCRKVALEVTE